MTGSRLRLEFFLESPRLRVAKKELSYKLTKELNHLFMPEMYSTRKPEAEAANTASSSAGTTPTIIYLSNGPSDGSASASSVPQQENQEREKFLPNCHEGKQGAV